MTTPDPPEGSFRYFLDQFRSNYAMRGPRGQYLWNILVGIPADEAAESWFLCCRMHLLADAESPDDVLPLLEKDRRLPRYPLETVAQHRDRLLNAWDIYEFGGTEYVIQTQLRAAGYGPTLLMGTWGEFDIPWGTPDYAWGDVGGYVQFRPFARGPRNEAPPFRTQFWFVFAPGFHPVTGGSAPWGDWTWGETWINPEDSGIWALEGLSSDDYRTMLGIVLKWKPSDHVFRGFRFVINEIAWGDPGYIWGDPGIFWGGGFDLDVPLGTNVV